MAGAASKYISTRYWLCKTQEWSSRGDWDSWSLLDCVGSRDGARANFGSR